MDKNQLVTLLKEQAIAVLSTVDNDGQVHGSTMFFTVNDDLSFYLLTKSTTRKFESLQNNNGVALTIIFENQQKTTQIEGNVENVASGTDEYRNVIVSLSEKNAVQGNISWPPPLSKIPDADLVIYKLIPKWVRYSDYSDLGEAKIIQVIP
jgi:uncharacterized protein YhbP (UPF0306 family)